MEGMDTFAAVVIGMVKCKQSSEFASAYAHCVVNLAMEPEAAWTSARASHAKKYVQLYTAEVQPKQPAQPRQVAKKRNR